MRKPALSFKRPSMHPTMAAFTSVKWLTSSWLCRSKSYHVDYRSGRTTYYLPDGSTLDLAFERPQEGIADVFDGMQCALPSWARNRAA